MVQQDPTPRGGTTSLRLEGLSSSVFSKALYMGVLQSMEFMGLADGVWLLIGAVGFL